MYSLILDSSTQILYISLVEDNAILFEKYIHIKFMKTDRLKNLLLG